MTAPLVIRYAGDIIPSADHNDVRTYIETGTYRVNTLSLNVGGTEIITSARKVVPVALIAPDSSGLPIYASDGVTMVALIDDNGNLLIKGRVLHL